jgi:hypothetical protein
VDGAKPITEEVVPASPSRRRTRGLPLTVALIAVLVGVVGVAATMRLSGQGQTTLAGQVEFGTTAAQGCDMAGSSTSFPASSSVFWSAHFREIVPAGTVLLREDTQDGKVILSANEVMTHEGDCLAGTDDSGPLDAGTYTLRLLRGTTEEASGTLTVK